MMPQYDLIEMKFPSSAEYVGLIRLTLSCFIESRSDVR